MALPFIVGPHQCSLTQGPEGRPQIEVTFRLRLPLAEFLDALLLSLADQHPLFQQSGHAVAKAPPAAATAEPPASSQTSLTKKVETTSDQTGTASTSSPAPSPERTS